MFSSVKVAVVKWAMEGIFSSKLANYDVCAERAIYNNLKILTVFV